MTAHTTATVALLRFAPWMYFTNSHPRDLLWPVSMLYAQALARREGWRAEIIDLHVETYDAEALAQRVRAMSPRVLLVDSTTPTMATARRLAARLKDRDPALQVWGVGQHASELPGDLLYPDTPFDGCLLGEYDAILPDLLRGTPLTGRDDVALLDEATGEVRTGNARAQVHELDDLPAIDPGGLHLQRYQMRSLHAPSFRTQRWGYLLTSRGCPHRCVFCSPTLRQSYGRRFRGHSAERVVDDMARLKRDHGVTSLYLLDDAFSLQRQRVLDICTLLIRRKVDLHWAIQTRADDLDPELLAALHEAGCHGVKIGYESGVDHILRQLRKGTNRKLLLETAQNIRRAGLSLTACYMLGNPGETLQEMEQTFRFAQQVGSDMIQVSFHTPYPGSASYEKYREQIQRTSRLSHYDQHEVILSDIPRQRLEQEQRRFYRRYYLSPPRLWNYLRRRAVYKAFDPNEWKLLWDTLRYLHLPARYEGPTDTPERPTSTADARGTLPAAED